MSWLAGFVNRIALPEEVCLYHSLHTPQETPPANEPNLPPPALPDDEPVPVQDPPDNPRPSDKPLRM